MVDTDWHLPVTTGLITSVQMERFSIHILERVLSTLSANMVS